MPTRAAIDDFLAQKRLAFIGASHDPKAFSATAYRELRSHGYELFPVNAGADTVEGDPCARSVDQLPHDLDGAIVMVSAEHAAAAVQACVDHGIPRVWLHKGVGPSSVSQEAVAICREHGVEVIDGACPLMFTEPAAWFHRVHRLELKLTGRLPGR